MGRGASMVTGCMAHVVENHQGFGVGNIEQPGDLEQVRPFGVGDVAVAPCRGGDVLQIFAVGAFCGIACQPEFGSQPRKGKQFAGADDAVFKDPVQQAKVGVYVPAGATGQAVNQLRQWRLLARAAAGIAPGASPGRSQRCRGLGQPGNVGGLDKSLHPGAGYLPVRGPVAREQPGGGLSVAQRAMVLGQGDTSGGTAGREVAGRESAQIMAGQPHRAHHRRRGQARPRSD